MDQKKLKVKGLTRRQNQVAGLAACGLAKKETAERLGTKYGTINSLLDRAYKKTGTSKLNELGSWWINKVFNLEIDFEQLQKQIIALSFLALFVFYISMDQNYTNTSRRRDRGEKERIEERESN